MIQLNDKELPEFVYHCKLNLGEITSFPREEFSRETRGLSGNFELILREWAPKRSQEQSAVFRWYCSIIARETGHTPTEVARYSKALLLPKDPETNDPKKYFLENYENIRNTSDLSAPEFFRFLEEVRLWAQISLNITLPIPDAGSRFKPGINTFEKLTQTNG